MITDLNTLLTARYVKIDDEIGGTRWLGRLPLLSDSELVCLAVAQALLGYCTPTGMPILWALADPKLDEREVPAMLDAGAGLAARREGILLISDKGFASKASGRELAELGIELLRPPFKREKQRFGEPMLKKVRQLIDPVNDTLKGQLNLEQHDGRTFEGVAIRVAQRVLAMAAGTWHNHKTGALVSRPLVAYDHGPVSANHPFTGWACLRAGC